MRCVATNMADSKVLLIRESSLCPLVWPRRIGCQKYRFFADVRVCWGDKMNPSLLPHCFLCLLCILLRLAGCTCTLRHFSCSWGSVKMRQRPVTDSLD